MRAAHLPDATAASGQDRSVAGGAIK